MLFEVTVPWADGRADVFIVEADSPEEARKEAELIAMREWCGEWDGSRLGLIRVAELVGSVAVEDGRGLRFAMTPEDAEALEGIWARSRWIRRG